MKKKLLCAILAAAMLTCLCVNASGLPLTSQLGALRGEKSLPEPYGEVLETYYNALYADWYVPLTEADLNQMGISTEILALDDAERAAFGYTLEDINGDGVDELFIGMNNDSYTEALYQVFTLIDGALSCVYVSGDGSAAYLRDDGTLLYESVTEDDDMSCFVYVLNSQGYAVLTDGAMSADGVCYAVSGGNQGPEISQAQFDEAVTGYEQGIRYLRYTPIANWQSGDAPADPSPREAGADGATSANDATGANGTGETTGASCYYTHQTLSYANIPVANVLVPQGWSPSVSVNWSFVSTTTPGIGQVTLDSPDGHAQIGLISNQSYADMYVNGAHVAEGIDQGLYTTNLHYRNASDYQPLLLQAAGYADATAVEDYEVSDSMRQMAEEAAQVKLQSLTSTLGGAVSSEGTAADRHYVSGNYHIEYLTLVTAARTYYDTGHVQMDSTVWNVPVTCYLIADSQEAYDLYRPVFAMVCGNSSFTMDFLFVVLTYGSRIDDAIHAGLMRQSWEYILSDSGSWLDEYQSSPDYDFSKWAEGWSDVIKEQNEYVTTDGGTIKVDTKYDTVYQNGDQIYMGPDSQAPDGYGWSRLELAR